MGNPKIWIAVASLLLAAVPVAADLNDDSALDVDAVSGASLVAPGQPNCSPSVVPGGGVAAGAAKDALDAQRVTSELLATPYATQKGCFPEQVRKKKGLETNGCWYPKYDQYVDEALDGDSDLSGDSPFLIGPTPDGIQEVCPKYESLKEDERRIFWRYFFQAMAGAESGFKKQTRYKEAWRSYKGRSVYPKDPDWSKGKVVYSEGLFQLSFSDASHHPKDCRFSERRPRSIFDPKANIRCAVGILRKQLFDSTEIHEEARGGKPKTFAGSVYRTDKSLFYSGSYWSILRKKKGGAQVKRCLAGIPGYRRGDLTQVPEEFLPNVTACQGFSGRKVLAQFWEGYPHRSGVGKSLCGRKNLLDFCGTLQCAEVPKKPRKKPARPRNR